MSKRPPTYKSARNIIKCYRYLNNKMKTFNELKRHLKVSDTTLNRYLAEINKVTSVYSSVGETGSRYYYIPDRS